MLWRRRANKTVLDRAFPRLWKTPRSTRPTSQGALFEPLCHKLLDTYPEGRTAFEHAASIDLEAVKALTREIIRHIELPESYALTEKRAAHIHAVLQIGMERIRNILCEK